MGQANWEEVDHAAVGTGGQNYGWNLREGDQPYNGGAKPAGEVDPVFEYDHSNGNCGIIGGFVYRGTRIPGLVGQYLYGDLCTGVVSAFSAAGSRAIGAVVP
ncbi:MAG: PQQ-dependent sugar dehydrogenase, partial [Actinobacteria bacterium]|nr:PQQ-dependent sugar dehydrogenase [Actinomycetota bacterium]